MEEPLERRQHRSLGKSITITPLPEKVSTTLIYPEFKGYHGNLYWATLETTESPVTIISETPNLFMQLFTPAKPQQVAGGTYPPFPDADISFLYEIPGIGTKFQQAEVMGPNGQKGEYGGHRGDENYPIKLWFDFR